MGRHRLVGIIALVAGVGAVGTARAQTGSSAGPAFDHSVLEMTPETLDRFGHALAAEDGARRTITAHAAPLQEKARLTKAQYEQCQMNMAMKPEYMELLQEMSAAMSGAQDAAAQQKAAQAMVAKTEAFQLKECGPNPSEHAKAVDVSGELRQAEAAAAKENGFTVRQYAILKERATPLCLADADSPGATGLRLPGDGRVFYVYTAGEVQALRPRCEAILRWIKPAAR